ncbi:Nucleotide-binding universal stress protein, UspA family [Persephonella hydrogeniphila]|uniref:Nucleotide-binding universal stress protein, UspA family n=1 Tax=Persephonella hydrogeniphila TaxID=198703 RepID=A0A285NC32_9AQUI|nr:universal stress protein [Persephonella hydrogeniphila]SNZ07064.1 Nucleotide-binding universal stress protein, UspA family [Persephonella hydrogeniphila]
MHFEKILVGVDFSDISQQVIKSAVFLAKIFNSEIKLVHVVENTIFPAAFDDLEPFVDPEEFKKIVQTVEEIAEKSSEELEKIAKDISGKEGIKVGFAVHTGDIAEEILEISEQGNFDLIVIGAHKKALVESLLLGNEAEKIVNKARTSVLVVKGKPVENPQKILCGYDFLPNSIEALETAKEIAKKTGAEIDIVHADTEEGFAHFSHIYETVFQKKVNMLKELVNKLEKEGIKADFEIIKMEPSKAILEAVKDFGSELIVVGKRQRKDIKRFFLGTIAMKVVKNASVPVLIVRRR